MSIKNDGHYFCGAGGNRPDGSDEALTKIIRQFYVDPDFLALIPL
ncbi:copper resistance protein [Escherichia coli]|nr:copper resistance protein [Escherichia coli]